jgi:hypothetical protein
MDNISEGRNLLNLSLCLTKRHYIKMYREDKVEIHSFLTSALGGREL